MPEGIPDLSPALVVRASHDLAILFAALLSDMTGCRSQL